MGQHPGASQTEPSFLSHLIELRSRIIVSLIAVVAASVLSFFLYGSLVAFLLEPFRNLRVPSAGPETLFVNTLFEGFTVRIRISILSGIVLSVPVHLFNIVRFVFPGLHPKEKRVLSLSLCASFILTTVSFYYGYYRIVPISVGFLSSAEFIPTEVGVLLNYGANVFFILQFLLASLLVFQIPIVLEVLLIMNVLSWRALLRASRYVIVAIFLIAAVVTPPDIVSQVSIALPLIGLFYLTILFARLFGFGGR